VSVGLRRVTAVRYVAPLREGGSMPALVEGDDDGLYVVKLRGAGQGVGVLVAELVAGELARAAGLDVPELALVELDPALGKNDPDSEVRELLVASAGDNLGVDFLPGSVTWDPAAEAPPDALWASKVVVLDALVANPDRTAKNPNLLVWQRRPWLIDHGAALWFQYAYDPSRPLARADKAYAQAADHLLLASATRLAEAALELAAIWTDARLADICAVIPDEWLAAAEVPLPSRAAYVAWLVARRAALVDIVKQVDEVRLGRAGGAA